MTNWYLILCRPSIIRNICTQLYMVLDGKTVSGSSSLSGTLIIVSSMLTGAHRRRREGRGTGGGGGEEGRGTGGGGGETATLAAAADAALEGDTSGDLGTEETLSEYEQQRLDRIARNDAVMVSLGIDCSQTRALPRGGARASKPVPATNPGSGESTKRDKGKAPAEPSENARGTSFGVSKSHQGG